MLCYCQGYRALVPLKDRQRGNRTERLKKGVASPLLLLQSRFKSPCWPGLLQKRWVATLVLFFLQSCSKWPVWSGPSAKTRGVATQERRSVSSLAPKYQVWCGPSAKAKGFVTQERCSVSCSKCPFWSGPSVKALGVATQELWYVSCSICPFWSEPSAKPKGVDKSLSCSGLLQNPTPPHSKRGRYTIALPWQCSCS